MQALSSQQSHENIINIRSNIHSLFNVIYKNMLTCMRLGFHIRHTAKTWTTVIAGNVYQFVSIWY